MKTAGLRISKHLIVISLLCTFFITYPNIMWIPWNVANLNAGDELHFWATFIFRCIFFFTLFYCQIRLNGRRLSANSFITRLVKNVLFTLGAATLFIALSYLVPMFGIQSGTVGKHLTFQFLVVCLLCSFIGYISQLNLAKHRKEQEIKQLKIRNLESRCNALAFQINPHFFFNSLNGISSLVRRGDEEVTIEYIDRLSDIFRYILQSDRKLLVPLHNEIEFAKAFACVLEVRFGGKLRFLFDIPDKYLNSKLPILSFMPLLENVTVHNRIDSSHPMTVTFGIIDNSVVVQNNICPKLTETDSNGTGLNNLNNRFQYLTGELISIENDGHTFKVTLPLTSKPETNPHENTDC